MHPLWRSYRDEPLASGLQPRSNAYDSEDEWSSGADDEEKAVGRRLTAQGHLVGNSRPDRTMRSMGKKDYGDADGSGEHTASDSDGGNGGDPSDDEHHEDDDDHREHHARKKRGGAGGGTGAGQAAPGDRQPKSSKTPWIIGGVVAVIVVVVLCVGLFLWYRSRNNSPSDADPASSSSGLSSSNSGGASSAASASAFSTLATAASPAPSLSPNLTIPSTTASSREPSQTASATSSALKAGETYAAQLTWFEADNKVSDCGSKAGDEDYVVRVGPDLYGSSSGISTLCGTFLTLYHLEKDAYVRASVEGLCDECTGHNLIVSQAVFHGLTDNLDIGMTLSQYWLTDAEHEPKHTIKSPGAANEGGATRTAGGAGATETGGAGGTGGTRGAAGEADLDAVTRDAGLTGFMTIMPIETLVR